MSEEVDLRTDTLTNIIRDLEKFAKHQSRYHGFKTYSRPELNQIIARLKALQVVKK